MKRKLLLAVVLLVSLLSQLALADIVVTDFTGYLVEMADQLQPWIFYEITNTGSETVNLKYGSEVFLLDHAGNTITSESIIFSPEPIMPGAKAYGNMSLLWGDQSITSMDQVADYHLNIQTEETFSNEIVTYYEPESLTFELDDSSSDDEINLVCKAVYKNQTGTEQISPPCVFVLRDEHGKLVYCTREGSLDTLQPGDSFVYECYIPHAIKKLFKENNYIPYSMEAIIFKTEFVY